MTDLEIVRHIRTNELEKPIKVLYSHFPYVRQTLFKYGAKHSDVQEIFNDALVILIEKVQQDEFQLTSKVGTFLTGVSINLLRNQLRKQGKEPQVQMGILEDHADFGELSFDEEKEEKLKVMDQVLNSISEKCKRILQMFYVEKKSMQVIAQSEGFSSVQSAKTQKYKCLESAHGKAKEILVSTQKTAL